LGNGYECRVRLPDGSLEEPVISAEEAASLAGAAAARPSRICPADPEKFRLVIESARIRLAYAHDRQFAVSLSGMRSLPHQKDKYRLRDFTERGNDEKLGLPSEGGTPAPLIDVLHRALWLMEYQPMGLGEFLDVSLGGRSGHLRLVAQALEGAALSGKGRVEAERMISTTASEQAALEKLMQKWRPLAEQDLFRG